MRFKGFFNKGVFLKWNQFSWILVSSTRMTWHWLSAIAGKAVSMLLDAYFRKDDGRDDTTPRDTLSPTVTSRRPRLSETGRSMVEMLGVLAIIGILSITGIAGYRYALTKYKANETMDELNKRAVVYATQVLNNTLQSGEILSNGEFGDKTTLGYDVSAVASEYENEFEIVLSNYPSEVCRDILKNYTVPLEIIIGNTRYNQDSDNVTICGEETAPETVFVYAADLDGDAYEGTDYPYEGTYGACSPGVAFKSGSTCYPCDEAGHYVLSDDEEYSLCSACGRDVFQGAVDASDAFLEDYCVPACRSGYVYHMDLRKCVMPQCVTNADCNNGEYCKLDTSQNGDSCTKAPIYGWCASTSGIKVMVTGIGMYQKSSALDWWSAQNYCQAIGGRMATVADFGCGYDYVGTETDGYCNTDTTTSENGTRSANMQAFQSAHPFGGYHWTSDSYSACSAYAVNLIDGELLYTNRNFYDDAYALCLVGN